MLSIAVADYPAECEFVLRRLRQAMADEEMRRSMQGEDVLLRDSILLTQQVDYLERQAERERAERAEQEGTEQERERADLLLAHAIRRLNGLGQDVEEIAQALSVDAEEVRRVLSTKLRSSPSPRETSCHSQLLEQL